MSSTAFSFVETTVLKRNAFAGKISTFFFDVEFRNINASNSTKSATLTELDGVLARRVQMEFSVIIVEIAESTKRRQRPNRLRTLKYVVQ
jgi:hypothetical protein